MENVPWLAAGSIFIITLFIFWFSPVHQLTDSNYSMLLSDSLLKHRSFSLDSYNIPRLPPRYHDNTFKNGEMYQLELVGPHFYYYMPPGSSVLSLPYVALMNAWGVSAANPDGTYNPDGEETIETTLAAILMAGLAGICFLTARLTLPLSWSVTIALAGALATQVWSTASRALWSDTWGIFLLGIVIWMLLAQAVDKRRLKTIALATLLAWSYFVRPTNIISIFAITIYVFMIYRPRFISYAVTGAAWFAGFVAYSWYNFHKPLPNYFLVNRLSFGSFWTAFAGNLVSPSRGLFVFVPILLFVVCLLVRHRELLPFKPLTLMALVVIAVHLVVVAGFTPWNGGFCYGPRYTTGVVPWFVLLAIVGMKATLVRRESSPLKNIVAWRAQLATGVLLLIVSMMLSARGAISQATWEWNKWPTNVDKVPGKIWDWRQPQFLAGLIHPPLPRDFPVLAGRIDFATTDADKYLWYGWSWNESRIRWSDGDEAAVIFALDKISDSVLQVKMGPFLVPGRVEEQRVDISLNGRELQQFVLSKDEDGMYALNLPKGLLKNQNILTFKFADAVSPKSLGVSGDVRKLAVRVGWMEFDAWPVN